MGCFNLPSLNPCTSELIHNKTPEADVTTLNTTHELCLDVC